MPRLNKPQKEKTQSTLLLPDISPLIWIHGTGPGSRGSVLVNLAQNGYRREAHKIIGLSRIASLIGRDSDGGLPELWDVMGRRRNKRGITRLMAICITRGSLSPQRARALIRDHNVDVRARDDEGRTALHYTLAYKNSINTDLIRVLIEACPELVKLKDGKRNLPLYNAFANNAPFDVIKLLIYIYPEGLQYVPFETLPPSTLVALAKEKAVKENEDAAENVAEALYNIALSESGRQACINSGAPSALVLLSQQEVVIANPFTRDVIFKSLAILSSDPIGSQLVSESLYIIYGPLSLYPAVCIGILSVVTSLLDQYDINVNTDEGKAVQFAIDNNLVDIRDLLILHGAQFRESKE
jgi:ankyrin repeat protein